MVPIVVSSELVVGSNRFLFGLTDTQNRPIASPELATTARFYDLVADPSTPVAEAPGTFIWTVPDELGLYHTTADFPRAGPWGVEIVASVAGQPDMTARAIFDVREASTTPTIGAAAPASDTPTATDAAGIAAISTDPAPNPAFYRTSVKDALAAGRPFVLVFSTPLFCTSRTCGPTLETVKAAAAPYGERSRSSTSSPTSSSSSTASRSRSSTPTAASRSCLRPSSGASPSSPTSSSSVLTARSPPSSRARSAPTSCRPPSTWSAGADARSDGASERRYVGRVGAARARRFDG